MPITFVLMWIATLAIAGIPLFAGFFSKDEILTAVFARTHGSTLADASWLGIPGSSLLYIIYGMGLVAALMTAIYMTRMMLYTFHGPNRTGEKERTHLAEAPWVMTGPLVVLGVLSLVGGWFNLPLITGGALGPVELLHHWLEPVVGRGAQIVTLGETPHLSHTVEYALIGTAVFIAVVGILYAVIRLKPAALVAAKDAPAEQGIGKVLNHKWYVDEAYDAAVVQPTLGVSRNVLWKGVDTGLIDGLFVNGSALFARALGWMGSQAQSGRVGTYAWVLVLGAVLVLSAFSFL
jgi:NADH-quinone oxidoreductase subunit L